MTNHNIFNKYVIHKFNLYVAANTKNYSLWDYIQVDFGRSKIKRFNIFYNFI